MSRKERRKAAAAARFTNPSTGPTIPPPAPTVEPDLVPTITNNDEIRRAYLAKFQPADDVEFHLVEEMINAQYRQRCLALVEDAAFAKIVSPGAADLTAAFLATSKCLAEVERARKAYALQFSRALAALTKLRTLAAKNVLKSAPQAAAAAATATAAAEPPTAECEMYTFAPQAPSPHFPHPVPAAENHSRPHLE